MPTTLLPHAGTTFMDDLRELKPGDRHYRAYVGLPTGYDHMGASQFRLLCTLGLREHHRLLDFGCGSLRAGRLFIAYLGPGRYHGIEPNRWLVEEGIRQQVGYDAVAIKQPRFDYNDQFRADVFGGSFDYILAQSVFSHTGLLLAQPGISALSSVLSPDGLLLLTFKEGSRDTAEEGWVYPGCVKYRPETIAQLGRSAGLHSARLPWYHPSQVWYLMTRNELRLPSPSMMDHLRGVVLFDAQFAPQGAAVSPPSGA
jgi:SAM-dependent methyltransferase